MTQKYVIINENGFPTAYYSSEIHKNIPELAIEISNNEYIDLVNHAGQRKIEDGAVVAYTPEAPEIDYLSVLKNIRDAKFRAGITYNGHSIKLDAMTEFRLSEARNDALNNAALVENWSVGGVKVVLNAAALIAIYDAGKVHLRRCFDAFFETVDRLDNITTIAELNTAFEEEFNAL